MTKIKIYNTDSGYAIYKDGEPYRYHSPMKHCLVTFLQELSKDCKKGFKVKEAGWLDDETFEKDFC